MEFEPLIKEMEMVIMPELQRRADALNGDSRFADVRVASMRHAEVLHTICLSCHPVVSCSPHDHYSIGVNIIAHNGLLVRGFVTWSQPYHSVPIKDPSGAITGYHNLSGYTIREGMTPPFHPAESGKDFTFLLPALYRAFDRGVRRGRPPGAFRRFWNRLFTSEK